jgi:hypothetical protein
MTINTEDQKAPYPHQCLQMVLTLLFEATGIAAGLLTFET